MNKKIDLIFSYFFLTNFSQSYVYSGNMVSLQYILQKNRDDMTGARREIENVLNNHFRKYFATAIVQVEIGDITPESSGQNLMIYAEITDEDGKVVTLSKALEVSGERFNKIKVLTQQ